MEKILVVAAHPDDDVLGCGASIAKWVSEGRVLVAFLAEGTTARFPASGVSCEQARKDTASRNRCAEEALRVLGVERSVFKSLPCGRLDQEPLIDLGKIVESLIHEFEPDTIFTHSPQDVNNDHRLCFQATLQATRPGALGVVKRLYTFEVLSSSEWRFHEAFLPNYFVDITSHVEKKIEAMYRFESEVREFPHPRSRDGILALSMYRGLQASCKHAEAFQLIREIP